MDSVDFAAFDFLVGAIAVVGVLLVLLDSLQAITIENRCPRPIHQFTRDKVLWSRGGTACTESDMVVEHLWLRNKNHAQNLLLCLLHPRPSLDTPGTLQTLLILSPAPMGSVRDRKYW